MVNIGERSRRYSRHPLKARARPNVHDAIPTMVAGRAENVWAAREEGKLILRHSNVQMPCYIAQPTATLADEKCGGDVIIFGVILLIIGLLAGIPILWTIGIVVLVIGAILWILGSLDHAVGGRRHYY